MIVTLIVITIKSDTSIETEDQMNDHKIETDPNLVDVVKEEDKREKKLTKKFIHTSRKSRDTWMITTCFGTDINGSISKITYRIHLTLTNHLLIYSREMETIRQLIQTDSSMRRQGTRK